MSGGSAVLGERARCKARRAVPWIALLVVVSSMAYGLNMFATAIAPSSSAASERQAMIHPVLEDGTLVDDAVLEQRAVFQRQQPAR
jgi:hypothetical protein